MAVNNPVKVVFGEDGDKDLDKFVYENLIALKNAYSDLHENKVPKWRRITKGIPAQQSRDFPWVGASNVVVQLVGENVDIIKAVQLGTIYEILPLWVAGLIGEFDDSEQGEEQRRVIERFMDQMGLKQNELDLYRIESKAAHDIAALGSVVIKFPWCTEKEQVVVSGEGTSLKEEEIVSYDGPKPEKLAFEDWLASPKAQTWQDAKFKAFRYRITKQECEKKVFEGAFDRAIWEEISNKPDIQGLTEDEQKRLEDQNFRSSFDGKELARWEFYECWLRYRVNDKTYSIIYTIHLNPQKRMGAFFNFYPKNEEPCEFGRLGYSDDGLIGYGFAEMGEMYQEEVSTGHNQRVDNRTLANTSVLFAGNNPRVDSGISLFPMAVLPFHPDEVDIKQLGSNYPSSVDEEQLTLALARSRFGTDMMSPEGMGSGTVNKKGGYSSMGTFSIMQQGARRINVNVTDFRYLHLNIGQKLLRQYAYFGIGQDRLKYYGTQAPLLSKAFNNLRNGRIELPIKAATASINREIEKQTGMLFTQVMQRHYGMIAQILQGVTNPIAPPPIKDYLVGSISAMSYIMARLLLAFGYDDIKRMQPELDVIKLLKGQGANNGQQGVPTSPPANKTSVGGAGIEEVEGQPSDNDGTSPAASAEATGGILTS